MLVQTLADQIRFEAQDEDKVAWSDDQLIQYLRDAVRQVCIVRPDASVERENVLLAAGETRHAFPAGFSRLLAVLANMGADGTTRGSAIRKADFSTMEAVRPQWYLDEAAEVGNYFWEPWMGEAFYVHPAPESALYIEAEFATVPDIASLAADFPLDDRYAQAAKAWAMHLLFLKELDDPSSAGKAKFYYDQFNALIGGKTQADAAFGAR
jgi:hypothetical protein